MYCVFSYGRRVLSSGSIVKVRLFEAWPKRPLLGKYFTINGQIDLDESPRGHNAKKRVNVYSNLVGVENSRWKGRDRSVKSDRQSSLLSLNVLNG